MRHSTPTLTAKHYVDPAMLDTAGAVEKLPAFERGGSQAQRTVAQAGETGTGKCSPKRPPSVPFSLPKRVFPCSFVTRRRAVSRWMADVIRDAQSPIMTRGVHRWHSPTQKRRMVPGVRFERTASGSTIQRFQVTTGKIPMP